MTELPQRLATDGRRTRRRIAAMLSLLVLANLAVWAAATGESKVIEWDAKSMTTPNAPELAQIVRRAYRQGYEGIL